MTQLERNVVHNQLLAGLPAASFNQLAEYLELVALPFKTVLHASDDPIDHVHFVEHGYVSLIAFFEDGEAAEVGMVGHEGFTGLPLLFGVESSPLEALIQAECTAYRMPRKIFLMLLEANVPFRNCLMRYVLAFQMQIAMTAACNGKHPIEQRLARWLLMAHDRTTSNQLIMTHEFLSMMLGVRRAGVTVAASRLQKAGVIKYSHGQVTIKNRSALERVACRCHSIVNTEYAKLFCASV